jgi:hypothetical protein
MLCYAIWKFLQISDDINSKYRIGIMCITAEDAVQG